MTGDAMKRVRRVYGAGPIHLLAYGASIVVAAYAAAGLFRHQTFRVALWFAGSAVGHDLVLLPLYGIADLALISLWRRRPDIGGVSWLNYVRFPAAISAVLLLIYLPEISRRRTAQFRDSGVTNHGYLDHWLLIAGVLLASSAALLGLRLAQVKTQKR
jgi:hypothetical protein